MKIKLKIQGRELELEPKEARALYDDLAKVFQSRVIPQIIIRESKREPENAPVYIPIVYPVTPPPPLCRPPSGPWCDDGQYPKTTFGDPLPCPQAICEAAT